MNRSSSGSLLRFNRALKPLHFGFGPVPRRIRSPWMVEKTLMTHSRALPVGAWVAAGAGGRRPLAPPQLPQVLGEGWQVRRSGLGGYGAVLLPPNPDRLVH